MYLQLYHLCPADGAALSNLHYYYISSRTDLQVFHVPLQGLPGPQGPDGWPVRLSLFFSNNRINLFSVHGLNNET